MSREQDIFILADESLLAIVQQIQAEQWEQKVPEPLANGKDVTLRQVINYHAYDDAWIPDTVIGKTIETVGTKYDGDLLGDDPKASFAAIVDKATTAVRSLAEADLEKTLHFTYGDYPVREGLVHPTAFRGFRFYTIAKYIGVDSTMSPELVTGLSELVLPHVEEWRAIGIFGPAIDTMADADKQTKLLGITGFLQD